MSYDNYNMIIIKIIRFNDKIKSFILFQRTKDKTHNMDSFYINLPGNSTSTNPASFSCLTESPVDDATATREHQALFEKISFIIYK